MGDEIKIDFENQSTNHEKLYNDYGFQETTNNLYFEIKNLEGLLSKFETDFSANKKWRKSFKYYKKEKNHILDHYKPIRQKINKVSKLKGKNSSQSIHFLQKKEELDQKIESLIKDIEKSQKTNGWKIIGNTFGVIGLFAALFEMGKFGYENASTMDRFFSKQYENISSYFIKITEKANEQIESLIVDNLSEEQYSLIYNETNFEKPNTTSPKSFINNLSVNNYSLISSQIKNKHRMIEVNNSNKLNKNISHYFLENYEPENLNSVESKLETIEDLSYKDDKPSIIKDTGNENKDFISNKATTKDNIMHAKISWYNFKKYVTWDNIKKYFNKTLADLNI